MAPVTSDMLAEAAVVCDEIERAHERCGQAHVRVMQLEDQRQSLKAEVIRRLVDTKVATSASAAERIVEQDAEYQRHRASQFEAEVERWRALGQVEVVRLRRRIASATIDG
jgi:putative heme iron utilization protein